MDDDTRIKKPSKWDSTGWGSKLFTTWIAPLFLKGLKKNIEFEDLYKCSKDDEADLMAKNLEKYWNQELKKKNPSFLIANIKCFGLYLLYPVIAFGFEECFLHIVQPILLGKVIEFFANKSSSQDDFYYACIYAAGLCLASILFILIHHPTTLMILKVAMKCRVAWCTMMYQKALRLSHSGLGKTTLGQILNLMSNDVSRFDEFWIFIGYFFVSPVQAAISVWLCWGYIGPTVLIGAAILALFIPFQGVMGRLFFKIRTKVASISDNRIRMMNEFIRGMRVIKMYAWEKHFSDLISSVRKSEMVKIRFASYLRAFNIALSLSASKIILFFCFITYVLLGNHLNAEKVFVTMFLFNTLRHTMTWMFPQSIGISSELYVACGRVQRFLLLDELEAINEHYSLQNTVTLPKGVTAKELTIQWNENLPQPTLEKISVELKPGELLAVIGPVGSGKTSFLMSCLNEIPIKGGQININGKVAYAAQEPWSFNSNIRQNILFGSHFLKQRYDEIVRVCALKRDFKLFPHGDRTLVGERGVQLSGGQKARITLARALYNDADIYLLDDPLSAVDSEVANHIFEKCIIEFLKSKAVILVTHQLQFIKKATRILALKDGKTLACGTYDDLLKSGLDFMSILKEEQTNQKLVKNEETFKETYIRQRTISVLSTKSEISVSDVEFSDPKIEEEYKATGAIDKIVYWKYLRAGGGYLILLMTLMATLGSQAMIHYSDIWLSEWTNSEDAQNGTESDENGLSGSEETIKIIEYTAIILATFIFMLLRSWTFFFVCTNSSVTLHNKIFFCLLRAPMAVFDNNPVGRILNRFTRDMGIVDEQLPICAYDLNLCMTQALGILIVVIISTTNLYLVAPAFVLAALILWIRGAYIKTARDLKRFEGIARSPLYNQMTTTLNGLSTIRAFRAQELFKQQYYRYQDDHSATWFLCLSGSRILGITMDWLCTVYIVVVTAVIMVFHEDLPSGSAGLALSMALGLTGLTQWGVRQSAEVENQMTNVERILEYSRLPSEAALEIKETKPAANWPQQGVIVFKSVSLTYANSPKPVLSNVSFEIKGGEKIGIVGRTGAGKSSLLTTLFRMTEPEGAIIIDDINIQSIGLHDLRKKLSIIPQDPVAFIGSLRHNLDPFEEQNDEKIWKALEQVQLKSVINELPEKLNFQLCEGGTNFSVGQRQLICLARAILRNNKILVLDEATANVDHKTDELIQRTIRSSFKHCTVITIAHRLNTIIDSDRVMVLDAGTIVEFDKPINLLRKGEGLFFKLVNQTGPYMAGQLNKAAQEAEMKRGLIM